MRPLQLILGPSWDDTAEKFEARLRPVDMMEASIVAQIVRAHWRLQYCEKLQHPNSPDIDSVRKNAESSIRRNMAELRQLQADRQLNEELNLDLQGVAKAKDILQSRKLSQTLTDQPNVVAPQPTNHHPTDPQRTDPQPTNHHPTDPQPSRDQRERPSPQQALQQAQTNIQSVLKKEQELNENILKKRTQSDSAADAIPRNAPCPCGSRLKHKRCCGKNAPPIYHAERQ